MGLPHRSRAAVVGNGKLGSAFTRSAHGSEHEDANQPAKGPHQQPIGTELPPAHSIPTHHTGLGGQPGPPCIHLLDREIPDCPRNSRRHRPMEIVRTEGQNVAYWPPESTCYPEHDFSPW